MAGLGPRAAVTLPAAAALALLLSFLLLKRRRSKRNSRPFSPDTAACLLDSAPNPQSAAATSVACQEHEEQQPSPPPPPLAPRPTCAAQSHDMRLRDGSKMGDARLSSKGSRCSPAATTTTTTTKTAAAGPPAKTQCAVSKASPPPPPSAASECSNAVAACTPPTRQQQQQPQQQDSSGDVVVAATTAPVTASVREQSSSPPCAVLTVEIPEQRGGDRPASSEVSGGEDAVCEASPSGSVDSLLGQSSSPPSSTVSPARRESGSESAALLAQDVAALSLAERTTAGAEPTDPTETPADAAGTATTATTVAAAEPPQSAASPTGDVSPKVGDVTQNEESVSEDKSQAQALSFSDAHSEGSSDSGKGGSDIVHGGSEGTGANGANGPCPEGEELLALPRTYEFELPRELCGRFIGQGGRNVTAIKSRSNTRIYVHQHPMSSKLKLCSIEGTQEGIRTALELIRKKFPVHAFPTLTLAQVNGGPPHLPGTITLPETLQLRLPDGVTCDVVLTSLVTAGHFFLQQPTHPTYPSLSRLDQCMLTCYGQGLDTPPLPHPVEAGIICAAHVCGGWFRALVVAPSDENEECDIKFLDYGGYMSLSTSLLRQIRSDFMLLPFQASECYLANVQPAEDDNVWSAEACATFEDLAQGQILQALIVGYADNGIPLVYLYRIQGVSSVFINQELVNRGVARWLEHPL